ncbi:MAG: S24/S26 family peptidase [Bacteroidales bacterium]|nr:S24/S26 family peptidase [Bacteroidales bacterium]
MYKEPSQSTSKIVGDDILFEMIGELISEGREVIITPKGNSMLPVIRNGLDRPAEVGDILLVKVGGRFIMHRVYAVEWPGITLMGDGNVRGQEHCTADDVIGIVTEIHKDGGRVVIPGKGRLWRLVRPFRRYILAIYKRVIL